MSNEKILPDNVINPFSEKFLETWKLWLDFRWQEHKFKYKGCISMQVALMQLTKKCGGEEDVAVAMIMQSIEHGWSGIYQLKTVNIHQNGRINQTGTTSEKLDDDILKQKLDERRQARRQNGDYQTFE